MNKKKRKAKNSNAKEKKHQKMTPRNPGIVEKLVNRALKQQGNVHYVPKAHDGLQTLFNEMFVELSANQGLLGDTRLLSISGDGSPVETGGRPYGKLLCNCRK